MLPLSDPRSSGAGLTGAKAANLALARAAGLPVLPGFVLTTASFDPARPGWPDAPFPEGLAAELRTAFDDIGGDRRALVVRSSSTVEDVGASSMAGQFQSCLDVVGWDAFEAAVRAVLGSSRRPVGTGEPAPMAVLVQRQVAARVGGVLFGLDPVTGDRTHILVEAVPGGPESLVSGTVTAQRYLLGRRGRLIEGPGEVGDDPLLDRRARRRIAHLAARAAGEFGSAQDVEWALDADDALWLLQSRPVTAVGSSEPGAGALLGPGPVGETFPEPLRALEEDLWLAPLRSGITSAITLVGAWPRRAVAASPVVTTVSGRVACDLDLLGASPVPSSGWRWLDPRVSIRRLASSWRVGRLRAVLPELAGEVCRRVDGELAGLGPLRDLSDAELLEVMCRVQGHLVAVHGHEVLAGTLLQRDGAITGAGIAMSVVRRGRALGLSDEDIVARWPVALALTPPRIGAPGSLPPTVDSAPGETGAGGATSSLVAVLPAREALRLRARWLQELSARAADVLARRLSANLQIPTAQSLVHLRLAELEDVVSGWPAPPDLAQRALAPGPPLPSCFRLAADGRPIRVQLAGAHRPGGRGAAQGRAQGRVVHDAACAAPGDVLVTRTLDPRLAGWLPGLGAVVCETGSVLSHLSIMAREYGVPTVVGVHDAVERFPVGSELVVDGTTGEVLLVGGGTAGGDRG
ncbi:MAG: PEP-utilizing enzyme [Candidatus Nanopelagicales bacterium]|nr:PEP-utilizing enzyme [Candidatus Nanopelagicales bacterium]